MNIPVILGTAREGRQSEKVANYLLGALKEAGHVSEIIDVKEYAPAITARTDKTPKAKKYKDKIVKADALLIVTPEYNHGYPGELKLLLDLLYAEYADKPVGFAGVSGGPLGGSRAVEQLRQVVIEFHMIPVREALYFGAVQNLFDEKGAMKDAGMKDRVLKLLDNLARHVKK